MKLKFIANCVVCKVKALCQDQLFLIGVNRSWKGEQHYMMNNEVADSPLPVFRMLLMNSVGSWTSIVVLHSMKFFFNFLQMLKLAIQHFTK